MNLIGGKRQNTLSISCNKKQAESKTKIHVAVTYDSINTKQLKNIEISTIISVGVGPHFDVKYLDVFSQSLMTIIKTSVEHKTQGY